VKQKIFLIGYMGSGKTTLGKLLAKKMDLQFLDIDLFIENRYHKSIASIFEERGEADFREIERRVLHEITGFENTIISTGGGLPCFFDNMEVMNEVGTTVYLKVSPDELVKRLSAGKNKRPLISGKNPEELRDFIETNLKKREPFYNKAAIVFEVEDIFERKNLNSGIEHLVTCLTSEDTDDSNE
jgi:shikimate kinase